MSEERESSAAAQSEAQPECFIIMPISDPDGYEQGHFRRVFDDVFVPSCERAGYRAVRSDQIRQTNLIHLDILQRILDSPMAVCDLSSRNPNVLFELGLRQAFDKPVVLVQEDGTSPIFDIAPLRIATYRRTMTYRDVIDDQAALAEAIVATKEAAGDVKSVNSIVRLLGLTHAASLSAVPEGEETPGLLRVIMNQLGAVSAQLNALRTGAHPLAPGFVMKPFHFLGQQLGDPEFEGVALRDDNPFAARLLNRLFQTRGLVEGCVIAFYVPRKVVKDALRTSADLSQFYDLLLPRLDESQAAAFATLLSTSVWYARLQSQWEKERAVHLSKVKHDAESELEE